MEKKKGRKPVTDKKMPLTIFLRQSIIDNWGGADKLKAHLTVISHLKPLKDDLLS